MPALVVSAIGRDRPGIVAGITGVLVAHGANLADSLMGILSGRFTMMLIVDAPDGVDEAALRADLERAAGDLGLDAILIHDVAETEDQPPLPSLIVTVYGADHPGIVHAVANALAEIDVNITDLNTRLIHEEGEQPLYAMMLEVAPPPGLDRDELEDRLRKVAGEQRLEVSVRELATDSL
jgi:glycine cleavage system transcriptional repressor